MTSYLLPRQKRRPFHKNFFILALLYGSLAAVTSAYIKGMENKIYFNEYIQQFNKTYAYEETYSRYITFIKNLDENKTFTKYMDMESKEFEDQMINGCDLTPRPSGLYAKRFSCISFEPTNANILLPESVDWRSKGVVTPVKMQNPCGSCWAYSAIGAIEGVVAIESGKLVSLSEQDLVDCVKGPYGCFGGSMNDVFEYAREYAYYIQCDDPFMLHTESCIACDRNILLKSCINIQESNQLHLKEAVTHRPISVAIQANSAIFQNYHGGIITDRRCGTKVNHGVLLVGYGVENDEKYWIVKNSWGADWGEYGYARIGRNDSSADPGVCGIAIQASYPSGF